MRELKLKITTLSEVLVGSGEGWGAIIDSDILFDEYGLPYIPAKRLKGVLRESALEVAEMFEKSGIDNSFGAKNEELFGKTGEKDTSMVCFGNLYLENYEDNKRWLQWSMEEYSSLISRDMVLRTFTNIRQQTAIDDKGIAKEKSLRTMRVLKRGISFSGIVQIEADEADIIPLCLAVCNLRYIGTSRNRGFGHICGKIFDNEQELTEIYLKELAGKEVKNA